MQRGVDRIPALDQRFTPAVIQKRVPNYGLLAVGAGDRYGCLACERKSDAKASVGKSHDTAPRMGIRSHSPNNARAHVFALPHLRIRRHNL